MTKKRTRTSEGGSASECAPRQVGTIIGEFRDEGGARAPIAHGLVEISPADSAGQMQVDAGLPRESMKTYTDDSGCFVCENVPVGVWNCVCRGFGLEAKTGEPVVVEADCKTEPLKLEIPLGAEMRVSVVKENCGPETPCDEVEAGAKVAVDFSLSATRAQCDVIVDSPLSVIEGKPPALKDRAQRMTRRFWLDTNKGPGVYPFKLIVHGPAQSDAGPRITLEQAITVLARAVQQIGPVSVSMRRAAVAKTDDLLLWVVIRKSTEAISFGNYLRFMDHALCGGPLDDFTLYETAKIKDEKDGKKTEFANLQGKRYLPFTDSDAYRLLKVATEAFLMVNCGVRLQELSGSDSPFFDEGDVQFLLGRVATNVAGVPDLQETWRRYLKAVNGTQNATVPYLALVRDKLRDNTRLLVGLEPGRAESEECLGIIRRKLTEPCLLELIWSYWHEEGMLVQTINAISRRFQNIRGQADRDPLANLEIDPLRPLNNLFWGYLQDEQHRLSVVRRTYEYDHHYGFRLFGKAVPELRTADSRSKFLEGFHNLLHLCSIFYSQDDDTTVIADGFPVLNALREVHLVLSEGAHNQFGDLPSAARQEMLIEEWLLARPEFREFLPTRIMVAYPEPWMDRVDAMKKLQGWTDTNVLHFRNLGVFGEQILLSVRFGAWSDANDPAQAANWARFWRAEIQGYIHAYRAVAGVDLTSEPVDATLPSVRLRERLARQNVSR